MSQKIKKILQQLENNTTLDIVQDFLKARDLPHSCGGWESLIASRIEPAIANGKITESCLISLLRDVEEHGKQHIFLYKCSKSTAQILCTEEHLNRVLKRLDLGNLQLNPKFLDVPASPTIVDARIEADRLVIKVADVREQKTLQGELLEGTKLTVTYYYERSRSTSVAVLHGNGVLEIRISSKSNWTRYRDDLKKVLSLIDPFVEFDKFREVSLLEVKNKLGSVLNSASDFSITNRKIRDAYGNSFEGSSADADQDLRQYERMKALDAELDDGSYCESAKVCLKRNKNGLPTEDIRILLNGMSNEFAITAKCTKQNYDYLFKRLWSLNRKVS